MTTTAVPLPLQSVDWSATALGPVSEWPQELLTAVRTFMPSRLPIMICWGEEMVQLYNEAFAPLLGERHPAAMGQRATECWGTRWQGIGLKVEDFLAGEKLLFDEGLPLFLDRHGYLEETYWNMSLTEIRGPSDERQGLMLSAMDDTARVVSNRRLSTIHELSVTSTAGMTSLEEVCQSALKVMSRNRPALPFAACYLREGSDLRLVASYGLTPGSLAFPGTVSADAKLTIARVARIGLPEMIDHLDKVTARGDIDPSPLGNAVPSSAMLIPLLLSGEDEPFGVIVLGANPYRAVDTAYRSFFDLVGRQLVTVLTDARAHHEQRRRAEMLAELQDSKTRFFQNVSHEFRTPLTLVLAGLDGLEARSGHEAEDLYAARRAALRLDRLVDALFTFARAESGALLAQREATDLVQLTGEAASMFRAALEKAELEYVVDLPDGPLVVDIDREMWSRIVVNLLSNAYKFTEKGSVRLSLSSSRDGVTLSVQDTGVGIAPPALNRVFRRFQQAQTAQVRSGPGAGIGLSLVSDLVSAHRGTIDVVSQPGVGSTFTVNLPIRTRSAPALAPAFVDERIHAQAIADMALSGDTTAPGGGDATPWRTDAGAAATLVHEGARGQAPDPSDRRLLLVEDNADLRQYLGRLLRGNGWTVSAVPDAESAVRHQEVPNVILTDVMLPGRDGLWLVRMIRANPDLATVPVILLTARAGAEAAAEGLRAGADDYIVKPFNSEELLARLDVHHELTCLRNYALAKVENQVSNLENALSSNRRIGAAIGVLMASQKVTSQEAFELLRRTSNESNRKLRDVADSVVLTGTLHPHEMSHPGQGK
jgi:signal transduction histidine kinase/DNA-binding response OmpR family regulator